MFEIIIEIVKFALCIIVYITLDNSEIEFSNFELVVIAMLTMFYLDYKIKGGEKK